MTAITYYVVLPFVRNQEGKLVAEEGFEVPSAAAAIMRALVLIGRRAGVIAFSRSSDLDLGVYGDAVILARFGETPQDVEPLPRSRPAQSS